MLLLAIKYRFGLLYRTLIFKIGLGQLLLKQRYGERILVFHGIDLKGNTTYNSRFISETFFEALITYLTTHYNVISLDDFYAKKFKKDTLNIAITFDDGYLNNYKYAVPILEKYNVNASFYITTIHNKASYLWADFIDLVSYHSAKSAVVFEQNSYKKNRKNEFTYNDMSLKHVAKRFSYDKIKQIQDLFEDDWNALGPKDVEDYWKLMNAEQLKEIANHPLFTIGAHGATHVNLIEIPLEDAKQEILESKKQLEILCEHPITEFAFPFGNYNHDIANYCTDIGFERLLLIDYNTKSDAKNETWKNRFVINPYITLEQQIAYLLKGSYL